MRKRRYYTQGAGDPEQREGADLRPITDGHAEQRVGASLDNCAGVTERGGEIAGKWVGLSSIDAVFSE